MSRPSFRTLVHGLSGGVLAGAIVALWFFIVDLAAGQPFHTPALLASTILGGPVAAVSARLVVGYTLLHFAVFGVLGMVTAWYLRAFGLAPGLVLGALFGVVVLDAVYYTTLLITGANVFTALPLRHVLPANMLGGMAMMAYLHRAERESAPLGLGVLREHPLLTRGLVTGLIGAGAVALWFFLLDIFAGRPFYTPAALGSVVWLGAEDAVGVRVTVGVVAAYTALHVAAFAALGVALVWTAEQIERSPSTWLIALLGFIVLDALAVGALALLAGWALGSLGWVPVAVANLVALTAMGGWVWRTHPEFRQQMLHRPAETRV